MYQLLSCPCALQGVLPKPSLAASVPQSSEVDWEMLYSFVVAGGGDKLASWALWGFMPISKCASPTLHCLKDILYTEITELLR